MYRVLAIVLSLLLTAWVVDPTQADPRDHDRARRAVEDGKIRPLRDILDSVGRQVPGKHLDTRLRDNGRWLYDVIILQPDGQVRAVTVDAETAQVLGVRGGSSSRDREDREEQSREREEQSREWKEQRREQEEKMRGRGERRRERTEDRPERMNKQDKREGKGNDRRQGRGRRGETKGD